MPGLLTPRLASLLASLVDVCCGGVGAVEAEVAHEAAAVSGTTDDIAGPPTENEEARCQNGADMQQCLDDLTGSEF